MTRSCRRFEDYLGIFLHLLNNKQIDSSATASAAMAQSNPFLLAAGLEDPTEKLRPILTSNPTLSTQQDDHGYTLLHAAASYSHANLLRCLVSDFNADPNKLLDEDGETCLFVVENVECARVLVEELGCKIDIRNHDGQTARDKIEAEAEFVEVAVYLRLKELGGSMGDAPITNGESSTHPPPLPKGMTLDIKEGQMPDGEATEEPDPEFRRRIEELAARDDFQSEEGQRQLRDLITDAVIGTQTGGNVDAEGPSSKRRG
jgi:uncharacterized protein